MIQFETARNGQPVFKVDGRSLVSTFDPSKEARTWAEKAVNEIGDRDAVIVVGLACGYHLQALRQMRPSLAIVTIEASDEIRDAARKIHPDLKDIVIAADAKALSASIELRDILARRFAVLVHAGQAQTRSEWTQAVTRFLNGRDALSFLLQLRLRPELYALFDEKKISALANVTEPISILTIRSLFKNDAMSTRERRVWRVLEELIV